MKKMFKSLVIGLAVLGLVAGYSYAGDAIGEFGSPVDVVGGGASIDGKILPGWSGAAGGLGGSFGAAQGGTSGFVYDGTVGGNTSVIGGGFSETNAYRFTPSQGDVGIGVGSWTGTSAVTGGHVDVNVDPDEGAGVAEGHISGFAAMGSLNGSIVGASPRRDWETEGYSAGVAGQGALGGFEGGAIVGSGPDFEGYVWVHDDRYPGYMWWKGDWEHVNIDSNAGGFADANISMNGFSLSESYRFMDNDNGFHTEGMGTFVKAETNVVSSGYADGNANGIAFEESGVVGGYVAAGGTGTKTVQTNANGFAKASANGSYVGSGSLNTTFTGSAKGGSHTTMTTHPTANGVVSTASANMQVTAQTGNTPQ